MAIGQVSDLMRVNKWSFGKGIILLKGLQARKDRRLAIQFLPTENLP